MPTASASRRNATPSSPTCTTETELAGEYVDVESGKDNDRLALAAALRDCELLGATLVIARLDWPSRNLAFLPHML